jgi:hypothetical protein
VNEAIPMRCPKCGEPPKVTDRVRETTQATLGDVFTEAEIVLRGTCKNGHKWFARDEKAARPDESD